ncbi:hypothetical protein OPQ81_006226 [Rhizoctonia solani]|nr:hypothetical protein OPQ81_006226 [Rhizoctonia solani]
MSSASSLSTLPPVEVSPWSKHALKITTPERKYLVDGDNMAQESLNYVGPPLPRVWHSSSVVPSQSGDIFIFGGGVEDKAKNDTWAIRVSGDSNMPLPPEENHTHITVTASLVDTTGEAPSPRGAHISVMMDGVLIVWGGITSTKRGELEPSDDCVYLLNIATRNWVKLDIQPAPSARAWHAACICENKLLVFGGGVGEQQCLNDLWSFDLFLLQGNPNWERIEVAPGSPRPPEQLGHKMIAYEMKLYVFGGYSGKDVYNDTWCFNMNTRSWTRLVCTGCAPAPYTAHAVALVGDVVYMFGGEDKNENVLGDTWCFKINGGTNFPS